MNLRMAANVGSPGFGSAAMLLMCLPGTTTRSAATPASSNCRTKRAPCSSTAGMKRSACATTTSVGGTCFPTKLAGLADSHVSAARKRRTDRIGCQIAQRRVLPIERAAHGDHAAEVRRRQTGCPEIPPVRPHDRGELAPRAVAEEKELLPVAAARFDDFSQGHHRGDDVVRHGRPAVVRREAVIHGSTGNPGRHERLADVPVRRRVPPLSPHLQTSAMDEEHCRLRTPGRPVDIHHLIGGPVRNVRNGVIVRRALDREEKGDDGKKGRSEGIDQDRLPVFDSEYAGRVRG